MQELKPFTELIQEFTEGKITAPMFELDYIVLFKTSTVRWPEEIFLVLDKLFADCDAYWYDDEVRDENDLDDEGLLKAARDAQQKLLKIK